MVVTGTGGPDFGTAGIHILQPDSGMSRLRHPKQRRPNVFDGLGFYQLMDQWLMPFYRWPETPMAGFLLGTGLLAAVCVLLGDISFNLAVVADRKKIEEVTRETVRMNNLSIEALQSGQGDGYRACNKLANDAFGRLFFLQVALSTASLWPIPFALAWMQNRFFHVEFPLPLIPLSLGFTGVFLLLYILLRVGTAKVRRKLPFIRIAPAIFRDLGRDTQKLKTWRELVVSPSGNGTAGESASGV